MKTIRMETRRMKTIRMETRRMKTMRMKTMRMKTMTASGVKQLMPGLPDHLTLELIATKLPWRAFHVLSLVSRAWLHAIRSHEVYAARVRCKSTETVAVIDLSSFRPILNPIPLYSFRDDTFHYLPPVPNSYEGIARMWEFVPLDGKLYLLISLSEGCHLYVLDLSGLWQWKQLASFLQKRTGGGFECCAAKSKIFVLFEEGWSAAYDLNDNTWIRSVIKPAELAGFCHLLAAFGEKLVEHRTKLRIQNYNGLLDHNQLRIYDPVEDEWRVMNVHGPHGPAHGLIMFMAEGKFHCIGEHAIYVHDMETNSWTHLLSHSFAAVAPNDYTRPMLRNVAGMDDELLVVVFWVRGYEMCQASVFRSKGLRSKNKRLVWQKAELPPLHDDLTLRYGLKLIFTIEL